MNPSNDKAIEAILFWKGEAMTLPELCRALKLPSNEVKKGLTALQESLMGHGITLIQNEDEIALVTVPEAHELIERMRKEELSRDLGKAALETLSVVLYKGKVSRRDIDYIRGVNSTAILRSLLIRGLIERRQSEHDERMFLYHPTTELISLLGITSVEELPEYAGVKTELEVATLGSEKKDASLVTDDGLTDSEMDHV